MAAHSMHVALKRAYEVPEPHDGARVLVDRLWARGISKETADLGAWMKELGPTSGLRTWFGHRPDRWHEFVAQYRDELATPMRQLLLAELQGVAAATKQNEAVVLRDYLLQEKARSEGTWDTPTTLLLTAAVVAAVVAPARPDAVASASGLKRFASAILTAPALDLALKELVRQGSLRESSGGWQLTLRGQQRARQLSRIEA